VQSTGPDSPVLTIGVISDTHGLLRPEALDALKGSAHIIHAGDVGDPSILDRLAAIAPVTAVRGNVDTAAWAARLPLADAVELGGRLFYVLHQREHLDIDPRAAGVAMVIFGHSHKPSADVRDGVLYLNPGSAGPRRFSLPVTVARVAVGAGGVDAVIVPLDV
jgi:putative phosphoesterase